MKRFTWIPIVAGVVLLLIALPVFGADLVDTLRPTTDVAPVGMEASLDLELGSNEYKYGCEFSDHTANPF